MITERQFHLSYCQVESLVSFNPDINGQHVMCWPFIINIDVQFFPLLVILFTTVHELITRRITDTVCFPSTYPGKMSVLS